MGLLRGNALHRFVVGVLVGVIADNQGRRGEGVDDLLRGLELELAWQSGCGTDFVAHQILHRVCGGHFRGDGEEAAREEAGKGAREHWRCCDTAGTKESAEKENE